MRIKGVIWYYNNKKRAEEILEDIVKKYISLNEEISRQRISTNENFVEFQNGDRWAIVCVKYFTKGTVCNISYIASDIDKEIINCIIMPCTKCWPCQSFNYYSA